MAQYHETIVSARASEEALVLECRRLPLFLPEGYRSRTIRDRGRGDEVWHPGWARGWLAAAQDTHESDEPVAANLALSSS
jgi:hypothetical protein